MIRWPAVVVRAAEIVRSYDTSVTLRQLFYRLVAEQLIPNTQSAYSTLSDRTAKARREGSFPDLDDRGRSIHKLASWDSPKDAMAALIDQYRIDRTEGQDVSIYLAVEKATMIAQMESWFGELGIPILALSGYSSQSYVKEVRDNVVTSARQSILLYAGDFDPSGEDIDRDFVERCGCWTEFVRVALDRQQVDQYQLPPNPGKVTDARAAGFVQRHGELIQVELEALEPNTLRGLFDAAVDRFWDVSAFEAVRVKELAGREALAAAAEAMP